MKNKGKFRWLIGGFSILAMAGALFAYDASFPIESDCSNLDGCVTEQYNRGYRTAYAANVKIWDSVTVGKRNYVLLEIDEDLGWAVLSQSLSGRYKINHLSYGDGNFREEIIESGGEKYLLYGGRNPGLEIASMTFTLDSSTYSLQIPPKNRFLVSAKIDSRIEENQLDIEKISLYNAKGEEITEKFPWSGVGI